MMLWGVASGALELRQENGGVRVSGRFPYATEAELAPGRFERIEAKAFGRGSTPARISISSPGTTMPSRWPADRRAR
jgi:hypothetical protein